jgi:hypothetical protein
MEWEVEAERQEEVEHKWVVWWNLAAMTEKELETAEKLWMDLVKERAHLDAECTEDEVEQEAAWCQDAMSSVPNATAKNNRIRAKSKRWLNTDIKDRRNVVGREKKRQNSDGAARAKAKLQNSIRQSKGKMWCDYLLNLRGAEVWRAARYANPWVSMTVEALTDSEGKQANTATEKEEMWRCECFPPHENHYNYELPPARSAHTHVTEQAVKRALHTQSLQKAPGPDKLSFGAIRLIWKGDRARVMRLTRMAIRMGRHPVVWMQASGVAIHTPCKDDYTKLETYRSITLLSCIGKVVKKVVTELLSEEAERWAMLSDDQCGSRKGRSAIGAAAGMVDSAHAAWMNSHIPGVLLMDIKAAFPSVAK